MKTFKKADLAFQLALLIAFCIISIVAPSTIYLAYFVVGSLQVASMTIHSLNSWNTRKGSQRYIYHRVVVITILLAVLSFVLPYLFFVWYLLLFLAPAMAVYYTWICFYEIMHAAKRPLEMI